MYLSCIQVTFCQMGYHFITYVPSIYVFKESQYVPVYIQTTLREKARWALCVECIHHKVICNMYLCPIQNRNMYLSIYRLHYAKKPDGLYVWNVYIIK
jgi:hypothetical protein